MSAAASLRAAAPRTLGAFARLAFTELLAYRLRYVVGVFNYVVYMAVQFFLWRAVFSSAPEGASRLGTFTFEEIVTYFGVGWIVRVSYYNNLDRELADRVNDGQIALDLLRPVSLLERCYGQALGEASFRVVFMGLPTALVLFPLFGVEGPSLEGGAWAALARVVAFGVSVVLAFHVFFLINFLVGVSTVWFEKIRGLIWAKFVLIQFLSGLLVPLELFPPAGRTVLEWLPFQAMIHGPLSIWLGRVEGIGLWTTLAVQAAWVAALWWLARVHWARARRRIFVFGG